MLGSSQAVLLGARAAAAATYDALVGLFDPDVVSYWKFQNTGADERGTQPATVTGSPELDVETIVHLDRIGEGATADGTCIAWPGTSGSHADAAHNAAHKTAQGTIVVTFQRDSATKKSILVAADLSNAAGGLAVEVTDDGAPRAFLRRQGDGVPVILLGQPGDVQVGQAYSLILKWGPAGLSLALWNDAGMLVRRVSNPLSDGVTGTSPIRFGTWHTDVDQHDGPFGRVIWLNRRLFDGEEGVLARPRTIAHDAGVGQPARLGAWPLSETGGQNFTDTVGGNTATLVVPSWTVATHEHNRHGIVGGTDHALEVSNGGPAIPMVTAYRQAEMSLVLYVAPLGELRGTQYWNPADARYGRELLAYCDNGSAPGSFAIERRRISVTEWRLDGYVRNASGTAIRFSGGLGGIAGALLPVDVAKRIVLTQGAAGATLYLDGAAVANLAAVTQGWTALTADIHLGSSSSTGHANDRSPFWGRLDEIEVWQGQLGLTDVQGRPAAASTRLWRYPSDFVGGSTDINIAGFSGNLQGAVDAAHAAGRYVYQTDADTTFYSKGRNSGTDNMLNFKANCKGFLGVRLRKPSGEDAAAGYPGWYRMVNVTNDTGSMGSHSNPYAASGGYKFIGCKFDGNGRNQNWVPRNPTGGQRGSFALEQAHALDLRHTGNQQTFTVDACEFYDQTGDALSIGNLTNVTTKSCRFFGCFRGPVVVNQGNVVVNALRYEAFVRNAFNAAKNGCGLQDIESFSGTSLCQLTFRDAWAEQDFDDQSVGQVGDASFTRYYNCHCTGSSFMIIPTGDNSTKPVQRWEMYYSTMHYHKHYFNFPCAWWKAFTGGVNSVGCLFDHTVFVADGASYVYHESEKVPVNTDVFEIYYDEAGGSVQGPRLWTMRSCEFRAKNLPGGTPTANVKCIHHETVGTSKTVELDGVLIDAAFADLPFNMGAATVRHRNVLHERTGSTKPWSNAGAVVAI